MLIIQGNLWSSNGKLNMLTPSKKFIVNGSELFTLLFINEFEIIISCV